MANSRAIITEAARRYGIDPHIEWGVFGVESSYGHDPSTSSAGAEGPFQFEPSTAKSLGVNPHDFKSAAYGAARYLAQYKNRGIAGMLSAYNAGPAGGIQQDYVNKVLAASKTYGSAPSETATPKLPGTPKPAPAEAVGGLDRPAYEQARKVAILGKLLSTEKGASENPLLTSGAVTTKAPDPTEYRLPATAAPSPRREAPQAPLPSGNTIAYVNPLSGFAKGRTDQGVDASAAPGTPIKALGNARVLSVSPNWYKGQPYVSYELLDGPQRGKVVYVAEQITPAVRAGQQIRAGQAIGHYAPRGTGIEMGFGTKTPGQTLAKATTGYTEGQVTPAGQKFKRFVEGIR